MSKKDFDKYVLVIQNQYNEFKSTLEQVSKEIENTPVDIDFMEKLKEKVNLIKQNYERVMYIKYLLDEPVKKSKVAKYKNQIKKKLLSLEKENNVDSVFKENQNLIKSINGGK